METSPQISQEYQFFLAKFDPEIIPVTFSRNMIMCRKFQKHFSRETDKIFWTLDMKKALVILSHS